MTSAAQAGLGKSREELLSVADQAVKMSIAWGVGVEQAGKSMATWRSSMEMTDDQAKYTADVINALSNSMNAEAGEIDQIFTRMGPMMASAGMATQDIAALATAFKAAGAQVEVSGTAMKNFKNVMTAGSAGLTDAKKNILQFLKIDPDELQKQFYNDSKGAILRVLEALKDVRPEEKDSLAAGLFGQESIAAISPLLKNIGLVQQAFQIANSNVKGSVDEEYANRMKTTATAISQMTQSVRNLGVNVGNALLPAVGTVSRGITQVIGFITSLVNRFPKLTSVVMIAGATIAALAVGSFALGLVINTVKTSVNSISGVFLRLAASQVTATASTGGMTLASTLFGAASRVAGAGARFFAGGLRSILVATGVGALLVGLGYGISLLIDNWDAVVAAMSTAWAWVKDTWGRLGVFFTELGNNLMGIFPGVWEGICGFATSAKEKIVAIWNGIVNFYSTLWGGIFNITVTIWRGIISFVTSPVETVKAIWSNATGFFAGLWQGIVSSASNIGHKISVFFTGAYEGVVSIWNGVTSFFGGIGQGIVSAFSWAKNAVVSVWNGITSFYSGLWNGILSGVSALWQKVVSFASGAVDSVKAIWNGVTSFFGGIGQNILEAFSWAHDSVIGAWKGITGFFSSLFGGISNAATNIIQGISGAFVSAKNSVIGAWRNITGFFSGLWSNITGGISGLWNNITSLAASALAGVMSIWNGAVSFFTGIAQNIGSVFTWAKDTVVGVWQEITGFFSGLWAHISTTAASLWQGVSDVASWAYDSVASIWNSAISFFTGIGDSIVGVFSWAWESVTGIWNGITEFFTGIGQGISDSLSGVWLYVTDAATGAWEIIAGIWNGALDFFNGIVEGISGIFTAFFDWLKEKFAWVFSTIDAVSGFIGKITGAVGDAWNKAFGDDSDKSSAQTAKNASEKPVTATAGATPKDQPVAPLAQQAKDKPVTSTPEKPAHREDSYSDFLKAGKDAKNGGKKSASGGGGGRARSGGAGSAGGGRGGAGSGNSSKGGPVTIVTLAGDNSKPQTLFIPASQNNRNNGKPSASPVMAASSQGSPMGSPVKMPATQTAMTAASTPRAMPQTPALISKNQPKSQPAKDAPTSISVDLKQQFDLIAADANSVRKVMESLKPDMEAMVRRALEKLQSDKRRTAFAQ